MASVLVFSMVVATVSIVFQIRYDYEVEKAALTLRIESILRALEPGLTNSLWAMDDQGTAALLDGVLRVPEIYNVALVTAEGKTFIRGMSPQGVASISRGLTLQSRNPPHHRLGDITVLASLQPLHDILLDRALGILAGQAVRTLVVVAFFLLVFWWLVSRHLEALSNFAIDVVGAHRHGTITLSRRATIRDELSRVSDAFNLLSRQLLNQQKIIEELRRDDRERVEEARADLLEYLDFFRVALQRLAAFCNASAEPVKEGAEGDALRRMMLDLTGLMALVGQATSRHQDEFDLPALLEQALHVLRAERVLEGTGLQMMMDESLPRRVVGDAEAFRQLVVSLVGGLATLSRPPRVVLLGQVISRLDNQHLRLRINAEDNGECLMQDWLDVLTHVPARLPPGLGIQDMSGLLRLLAFREWVTVVGGEYGFKAEVGKGNSVWFEAVVKAVPATASQASAEQPYGGLAVMLVGFGVARQAMLKARLGGRCQVAVAEGVDALRPWETQDAGSPGSRVDIVLLDGALPPETPLFDRVTNWRQTLGSSSPLVALAMPQGVTPAPALLERGAIDAVVSDGEVDDLLPLFSAFRYQPAPLSEGPFISRTVRNWSKVDALAHDSALRRILIADDDEGVLQVTRLMLESMGYAVDAVTNGEDVVKRVQTRHYDAVVLDCWMPVLDGFEAARRVRRIRPELPLIALTGSQSERARIKALEAGMNLFIHKPVRFEELQTVLASLL